MKRPGRSVDRAFSLLATPLDDSSIAANRVAEVLGNEPKARRER
jgi:hypothetical protein